MDVNESGYIEEEAVLQDQETTDHVQEANEEEKINWKEARQLMAEQKEQIRRLEQERYNFLAQQQESQQSQVQDLGDDDDYVDVKKLKSILSKKEQEFQAKIAMLETRSKYPDMIEVIEKYGQQLPLEVRRTLDRTGDWESAYLACKNSSAYYKDQLASKQHVNAKKAEENLKKTKSPNSISASSSALGQKNYYEGLTKQEILEMNSRFSRG